MCSGCEPSRRRDYGLIKGRREVVFFHCVITKGGGIRQVAICLNQKSWSNDLNQICNRLFSNSHDVD